MVDQANTSESECRPTVTDTEFLRNLREVERNADRIASASVRESFGVWAKMEEQEVGRGIRRILISLVRLPSSRRVVRIWNCGR